VDRLDSQNSLLICHYITSSRALYSLPLSLAHDLDIEIRVPAFGAEEVTTVQTTHLLRGEGQHTYITDELMTWSGCSTTSSCALGRT